MNMAPVSLPTDACDCHVHILDPDRFPYAQARAYTPPPAPVAQLRQFHQGLGIGRTVVVQPSCYAFDNSALCSALDTLGLEAARGVAVVDVERVSDGELERLSHLGVRGVRLNFHVQGANEAASACKLAADRIQPFGWHLQLYADVQTLTALGPTLENLPVPVVLDHFGGGAAAAPTVARLMHAPGVWVKLSAPYRVSRNFDELVPLVHELMDSADDRLLWASDWPHTGGSGGQARHPEKIEPFRQVNVQADLHALHAAIGDDRRFRALMVDNPARLYGF
ncbi:amidohydrolase family protein [Achromobacter agilis]|uniref:4-sulfomuconolactone hydrolase n=1 Tax=Achromobacter agilis TaxID=1353888 RepID=A0A446CW13_9BURK|nr:amidohydrolase family protein [Achromobacter agilis]SSW71995.1 4-sulfomuconolactone hydrolase [Achromobacter agilis]